MIVLKILFWVIVAVLVIALLAVLMMILALLVKIQIGFDYADEGKKLRIKYGIISIKIYPEMFAPEKKEKIMNLINLLKDKLGPMAEKMMGKAQDVAAEQKEKSDIKTALKNAEEFEAEEARIAAEEARIEAELQMAEAEIVAAEQAEKDGTPFPDIVEPAEVSKLESIKDALAGFDIAGAWNGFKSFMSGFTFDSVLALLSYIGGQTGHTLSKVASRIKIKQFCVSLVVGGGEDAAQTALKLGKISAFAFPAMGKLVSAMNVKEYDLDISPDFLAPKNSAEFHTVIAFRPLILFTPFIGYMGKVGMKTFSFYGDYKQTKKDKANGTSSKKKSKPAKAQKAKAKKAKA